MTSTRRKFLESAAANAAALAVFPASLLAEIPDTPPNPQLSSEEWDLSWTDKVQGKHKAVFDIVEHENGVGVLRAAFWGNQYMDVMKAAPADLSTVLVLRHNAIILAMNQAFWDKYNVAADKDVKNPMTEEPTKKNPALLDVGDGVPARIAAMALNKQLSRGAVVLACNLAFERCVSAVKRVGRLSDEAARAQAISYLVPGVILQPSGVFAVIRAQEAGAAYIKAS